MDSLNIDGHKMTSHLQRVVDWDTGQNVSPIYVEISPVGHCNHRCTFCAVDYLGYKVRQLDTYRLMTILSNMSLSDIKSIMFAGEGEPMLHPDISDIVNYTSDVGIESSFTTNGTAMTKKFVNACLKSISWIKVSINAGDEETYINIHKAKLGHWGTVWDNIHYAVSVRNDKEYSTRIGVQMVILPDNICSIPDLAHLCSDAKVDYLVIKPYSHNPQSETQVYSTLTYDDKYKKHIQEAMQYANSKFEIIVRENAIKSWNSGRRSYDKCYSTPNFWAYIMASGEVYACSAHIGDDRFLLGNINTSLFSDIWSGEKRMALLKTMENFDISKCRRNCRMEMVNRFLYDVKHPSEHKNFI